MILFAILNFVLLICLEVSPVIKLIWFFLLWVLLNHYVEKKVKELE